MRLSFPWWGSGRRRDRRPRRVDRQRPGMSRRAPSRDCADCGQLRQENRRLRRQLDRSRKAQDALRKRLADEKKRFKERLARAKERFCEEKKRLEGLLSEARRATKRQAAPFSKGKPKDPKRRKKPGRRSGKQHGRHGHRRRPERKPDRVVDAPLPERSPCCNARVQEDGQDAQFQVEIPKVRPTLTRFDIHLGHCCDCGKRVQGRHPEQTSDALGAAASQVGPNAYAFATDLHTGCGVSFEKTSELMLRWFDISITRGGLCQAQHRLARAVEPTYNALVETIRHSPVVAPDETGWKVEGILNWLWVFVTAEVTVYAIQPGRGFEEAAQILGEDFAGTLERDGWAPYRSFENATHQSCNAHLLRRCRDILENAKRGAARFPAQVRQLLQDGLALRERRDAGLLSAHGLAVAIGRLEARRDRLLAWQPTVEENRRLVKHLRNERDALFTYLHQPGVQATNWRAEHAVRYMVPLRKVFGGNRTCSGAITQQVLASVRRTSTQQGHDPAAVLVWASRSPVPVVAKWLRPGNIEPPKILLPTSPL